MQDSQSVLDDIFLSYDKILLKLKKENKLTKNNKEITHKDLRIAINIMVKKHPKCRWKSEKIHSRKHFILVEGYHWLDKVYFQKSKSQIDADIEFFETRIEQYKELLLIEEQTILFKDIPDTELENFFNRKSSTINRYLKNIETAYNTNFRYKENNELYVSSKGIELLCKKYFKQKYLEILENYKMELTEKYIVAGYPYDNFFGKN